MGQPLHTLPLNPSWIRRVRARWWRVSSFTKWRVLTHAVIAGVPLFFFSQSVAETMAALTETYQGPTPVSVVLAVAAIFINFFVALGFASEADKAKEKNDERLAGEDMAIARSLLAWMARYRSIAHDESPMARNERRDLLRGIKFYVSLLGNEKQTPEIRRFLSEVSVGSPLLNS